MNLTVIIGIVGYFVFSLVFIALMQVFREWYKQDVNRAKDDLAEIIEMNQAFKKKDIA